MLRPPSVQAIAAACAAFLIAGAAGQAGGRPFAYTQGVDTLPERELELESWFGVLDIRPEMPKRWDWWLGPVVGLSDRIEAGFFGYFEQRVSEEDPGSLVLSSLRLQLSASLAERRVWPVDVRLRAELVQPVDAEASHEVWLMVIAGRQLGRLELAANAGAWVAVYEGHKTWWLNYALGASVHVGAGLRVGAELYGDARIDKLERGHFAGPTLAYGTGRVWISFSWLAGLNAASADSAARVVLGVLL